MVLVTLLQILRFDDGKSEIEASIERIASLTPTSESMKDDVGSEAELRRLSQSTKLVDDKSQENMRCLSLVTLHIMNTR